MESFSSVDTMTYDISVQGLDSTGTFFNSLLCQNSYSCKLTMHRHYTPVLYYLSPPVVYHGATIALAVDPKWSTGFQKAGDWPFTEARIDGHTIDFQATVNGDTVLWGYAKNQILGMVGDQPPSNSSSAHIKFPTGRSYTPPSTNIHCNYDNTQCYNVRTVPKIDAIDAHSGYTTGGQPLTITGFGLDGYHVDVKVDGAPCKVLSKARTAITCLTSAVTAPSSNGTDTVGQHGLRRRLYNNTVSASMNVNTITQYPYNEVLAMHLESPRDNATVYGNAYSGWFKAPASMNYKFYIACDDSCELRLGSTNMSSAAATLILSNYGAVGFRDFWEPSRNLSTAWTPLVKDTYYFIEVKHAQQLGGEHVSVAVEIQQTPASGHPNGMREVQRLLISPTIVRDLIDIVVALPDSGSYTLSLLNPGKTTYTTTSFPCSASASEVKAALSPFFSSNWGAYISVTKSMLDSTGAATTNAASSVKSTWRISVLKALPTASVSQISYKAVGTTTATIQISLPSAVQLGNPPVKGHFKIQCFNSDGSSNTTAELASGLASWQILNAITDSCTEYRETIDIWEGSTFRGQVEDGRDIFLRFQGVNSDVPQFIISSGTSSPLVANNPQYLSQTPTPFGGSIFYEPIPFELLHTNETMPQVIVTVDTLPAVCAGLSCHYSYIAPAASISAFALSGQSLTITGTALPTTLASVFYSNLKCSITSSSSTQIQCSLQSNPVSGEWVPQVKDTFGLIPVTAAQQTTAVTVSSVSPSSSLNPSGRTLVTITGQNFPVSTADGSSLRVTFADGTLCDVQSTSSSQVTCLTRAFPTASVGQSQAISLSINGQSDSSRTVTVSASQASITAIVPNTASPVLKTNLTIQVDPSYSSALSASDLSVKFVSTSDPTQFKAANVIDVDSATKRIVVKFGGAVSGTYSLEVSSATTGLFNTAGVTLTTVGAINSFSPATGSIYGGQLITINGQTFSTSALDNEVRIGAVNCDVVSSTSSQIQCRTGLRQAAVAATDTIVVSLKASEEAKCLVSGGCSYQWTTTGVPALSSFAAAFDSALNQHTITFTGSGFNGDASTVQVYVDGFLQSTTSVTSTTVTATITGINGRASTNIRLYFPIGSPSGQEKLSSGISLSPSLTSIQPSVGSPAGSVITASVSGVGPGLAGALNLVTSSGVALCESVTIVSYGKIQCRTTAATYAGTALLSLKVGTQTYACANTDSTQCHYSTGTTLPAVSNVAVSSDFTQLQITGSNFYLAGYTANVTYAGVQADSVTITSATSAYATFSHGVPATGSAQAPSLVFASSTSTVAHWASSMPSISNTYTASGAATAVACSFSGGCLLSVPGNGLASSLKNPRVSNITVCGKLCALSEADSTASTAKCFLPPVSTQYSVGNFNVTMAGDITNLGTPFSSNALYTKTLFDGNNMNGWPSNTANCFIGVSYDDNYVGFLSQAKFYMNAFAPSVFVGKLSFQGSNDGVAYTTIFTVGQEIHTGWNYYDFKKDGTEPIYRFYRLYGSGSGSCVVGELVLTGQVAIKDTNANYGCTPKLSLQGATSTISATASYEGALTPLLKSIEPRFGTVKGGTSVKFSGANFVTDFTQYTIFIDGAACIPTAATATSVTCTSGKRPGLIPEPTLTISIDGKGKVSTQGLTYIYANLWSDTTTWGGEFQPMEGESVWIPAGLNLLVDIDSTPVLDAVLVEGSLIFPPNSNDAAHQRTFDAQYVFVNGGYLEVGTEQFPYTSRLTITMHGAKSSPEIPIYGNKVIGVRNGVLDLHGVARTPTWTELAATVNPGATTLKLTTAVDWKAGEKIVIASTSFNAWEAEKLTIMSVDSSIANAPVITFTPALSHKHYSGVETYGAQTITMRAEVGLLTRNVVFRGDPETSPTNQYGAHIMLHSMGDESLIGRIENIECTDVGQAYQLGRYPLHFHMIGTVHKSYIRGNAIHQTYNRAVTFHGVHYLRVQHNVAYNVMGHTFFVEDAIETNNLIEYNLAILTRRSWSLLNTDQTPASFWITNPYNILRYNHAAGSDRYGFWYDLQPNPTGPSYDPTICPNRMPLGEFSNNVGHSNGLYGIWLFHTHLPRAFPCAAASYDKANPADPYWQNPLVTASYSDFTAYKNGEVGLMFEEVGDVRIVNARCADNVVAGIEVSLVRTVKNGKAQVSSALVVGHSQNADQRTLDSACWGVITPRTDYFSVHNVNFYNYDQPGMAALGSCSHCFHAAATDSGARTVEFSGLHFDATVPAKINYQLPFRDIFFDQDGSLTGLGPSTWTTNYWEHNNQPECQLKMAEYNGFICNSDIQIRRLAFWNYTPDTFRGMEIKVLKYDDSIIGGMNNVTLADYVLNATAYSVIPFKGKQDPSNGWAVPYVTRHKYKIHWGHGIDFNQMQCDISDQWSPSDHNLNLVFNFTEARARVNFTTASDIIPNNTLKSKQNSLLQSGDNVVYNDTATRLIEVVINGKNTSRTSLFMTSERCAGSCFAGIDDLNTENGTRYWSNATSWPKGVLPVEGEDVVIDPTWNMVLDLPITPILSSIQINGVLTFMQGMNITLQANIIFVRAGILNVGSPAVPYTGFATILLYGHQASQTVVYADNIDTGNKMLANTGRINMYGQQRSGKVTRLAATANIGDTQITVEKGLDWVAGDMIAIAANTLNFMDSDYGHIVSYSPNTGVAVLDIKLGAYHWGASASTASQYNGVDTRAEVVLLTRNVVIRGTNTQGWGCQFLTSDFIEADGVPRYGRTFLDNVEVYNCSQFDNGKGALRFQGALGGYSTVSNSSFHHGLGWGFSIQTSANVFFQDNVYYSYRQFGGLIQTSSNITVDRNIILHVQKRELSALDEFVDKAGGFVICSYSEGDVCRDLKITNNVVGGAFFYGFTAPGHNCGDYSDKTFQNNIAHSIKGNGVYIFPDPTKPSQTTCMEGSFYSAYKCTEDGALTFQATSKAVFSYMTLIDNGFGAVVNIGKEADSLVSSFQHSMVYGETEALDCPSQNHCRNSGGHGCIDKAGFMIPYFQQSAKAIFPSKMSAVPIHKVKVNAAWGGSSLAKNLTFSNFRSSQTYCGKTQTVFAYGEQFADYIPASYYSGISFVNVDQNAMVYLYSPPQAWAVVDDCGEFPCTAPLNTLLSFEKVKYSGDITPDNTPLAFQIVANNPNAVRAFAGCKLVSAWNAYFCQNDNLGTLLFESVDSDSSKRTFSPMVIRGNTDSFLNTLNEFMDHIWDSFYTGQLRLSRFPSLIQTGQGANIQPSKSYNVSYTGTPPGSQRFKLIAQNGAITVRITYPKAGAYSVSDASNNVIPQNSWDDKVGAQALIKGKSCGESRFVGIVNVLEFYLTPNCLLQINPVNSVSGRIRLDWTVEAFYSSGSSNFIDRFASVLNIPASNIKIVSVYKGSVQILYQIIDSTQNGIANLNALQTKIAGLISSKGFSARLGAPVLDGDFGDTNSFVKPVSVVIDSTTTNTTIDTATTNNKGNNGNGNGGSSSSGNNQQGTTQSNSGSGLSESSKLAIIIALVVLFVSVAVVVGLFVYRKHKADMSNRAKTNEFASAQSNRQGDHQDEEIYEPQYHPKAELGNIFGAGLDAQVMKQKMNKADNVDGEDEEEYSPDKLVQITEGEDDVINQSRTEHSMVQVSQMNNDRSEDMIKTLGNTKASPDLVMQKKQQQTAQSNK